MLGRGRWRERRLARSVGALLAVLALGAGCSDDSSGLQDTCEMPADVVSALTGIVVGTGNKSEPYEGASECRYESTDGRFVLVKVDTNEGAFIQLGGREISGVGEAAKINGDTLYARADGNTWTFQIGGADEAPSEVFLIAIANEVL